MKMSAEYHRAWRAAHREQSNAATRRWRQAHPEKMAAARAAWEATHVEERREYFRQYQAAYMPAYYEANRERFFDYCHSRRDRRRAGGAGETVYRAEVAEAFGWICQLCGEPIDPTLKHERHKHNLDALSMDHIIPLSKGGTHTRDNVQPTHYKCNRKKGTQIHGSTAAGIHNRGHHEGGPQRQAA